MNPSCLTGVLGSSLHCSIPNNGCDCCASLDDSIEGHPKGVAATVLSDEVELGRLLDGVLGGELWLGL